MFKLIWLVIKTLIFGVIVLVIGNLVSFKGKTLSDQVKLGVREAQKIDVEEKIESLKKNLPEDSLIHSIAKSKPAKKEAAQKSEIIHPSERQKLKGLLSNQ